MILNNAPQAEAVLSNVGEIGEFRIRNSAKAFNILSSGLYANKIKAIIRELSCNAVDSHVAAGNTEPFEVHLPTAIEPFFSIRDFGTGLNHEQVTNIYTTYFESTKTNSNAFIGALGLGSKSPFSYTDNFTVTAIKDGHKGIYSAFINGDGVPSIALMGEEDTTEPAGVEIKFSVNERNDFYKFEDEARKVYRWFKQQPKFTGRELTISPVEYETKDIIPGVHSISMSSRSVAVMGNIAYPIEVPNADKNLEGLSKLLECGLVMEFGIGELDFQASREGLSYIPQTIDAIKNKLQQVNDALTDVLAKEADVIDNAWSRSQFLYGKKRNSLWSAAVNDYATKNNTPLFEPKTQWSSDYSIDMRLSDAAKFNIALSGFHIYRGEKLAKNMKIASKNFGNKHDDGTTKIEEYISFSVIPNVFFIANDTKVGSLERAKQHFRANPDKNSSFRYAVLLNKIDKNKEMDLKGFYDFIHNPPDAQRMVVSQLDERQRKSGGNGFGKNVNIMKVEERGGSAWHSSSKDYVWRAADTLDKFDDNTTYYYMPLKGFEPLWNSMKYYYSVPDFVACLKNTRLPEFQVQVYGVRKGDLPAIQSKKNWVNVESHVKTVLEKLADKVVLTEVVAALDRHALFEYNYQKLHDVVVNDKSPAKILLADMAGLPGLLGHRALKNLMQLFGIESKLVASDLITKYKTILKEFSDRYPLVNKFSNSANEGDVGEYINLIDTVKGV
jgi:hypothetical protein